MRMRIFSAAFVLGLGIVGITVAQQTGEQSNRQDGDRPKLRALVVKLRVEIELLELDQDADRTELLEIMKGIRMAESKSSEDLQEAVLASLVLTEDRKSLGKLVEQEGEKGMRDLVNEAFKKTAVEMKALRDRKRKEFARQATELAEKRLDLAEIEKRCNEAK
jgi:hypothetical protein